MKRESQLDCGESKARAGTKLGFHVYLEDLAVGLWLGSGLTAPICFLTTDSIFGLTFSVDLGSLAV